jgi:lysophospholipase L1-like esterase
MLIQPGDTVLFQGDSITDAGRDYHDLFPNSPRGLGQGYAMMAGIRLISQFQSDGLQVYNRGVSGNQIIHLVERWDNDCIALNPSVVSILIGVNDTWRGFDGGEPVSVDQYEAIYEAMLEETRAALPNVRFVLGEPFVLVCGVVTEAWVDEIQQRQAIVKRMCEQFDGVFVPFQDAFNQATQSSPPQYWLDDGVHPTPAGHKLMAETWLKAVGA